MIQVIYCTLFLVCAFSLYQEALSFRAHLGHMSRMTTKFYGKGGTIPQSRDRVRVELLDDVELIGHKGDILKVSKEQWMNVLLPRNVSKIVHEHEVEKIDKALKVMAIRRHEERMALMKRISEVPIIALEENTNPRNNKLYIPMPSKKLLDLLKARLDPKDVKQMTVKEVAMHDVHIWKADINKFVPFNFKGAKELRLSGLYKVILKMKIPDELVSYQIRLIPVEPEL